MELGVRGVMEVRRDEGEAEEARREIGDRWEAGG